MKTWKADDLNLRHLVTGSYSYAPKDIHVEAIFVTLENIGALSLEYEADLEWSDEKGPYFYLKAWRHNETVEDQDYLILTVRPDFWLVPLRGEIHLFDDVSFTSTFWDDEEEAKLKDYAKKDAQMTAGLYWIPSNVTRMSRGFEKLPSAGEVPTFPYPQPRETEQAAQQFTAEHDLRGKFDQFKVGNRIRVKETMRLGTVYGYADVAGRLLIEVDMDADGLIYQFLPENIEALDVNEAIGAVVKAMQTPPEGLPYKIGDWVDMGTRGDGEILNIDHNGAAFIRINHNTPLVASYWFRREEIGAVVTAPDLRALKDKLEKEPVDSQNFAIKNQDRVKVSGTEDYGTAVAMFDNGDVEVLLDNTGQTYTFPREQLEVVYPEIGTEKKTD
jgi:hypothetical protein